MDALSYSAVRQDFARTMDRVCQDREPVIVTRQGAESVVMMSLADYEALQETAYLMRSPRNARRLAEAIEELESGGGTERPLAE